MLEKSEKNTFNFNRRSKMNKPPERPDVDVRVLNT
jgi:hypothetical protein